MQQFPPQERLILGVIHHDEELAILIPMIFNQQVIFATDGFLRLVPSVRNRKLVCLLKGRDTSGIQKVPIGSWMATSPQ